MSGPEMELTRNESSTQAIFLLLKEFQRARFRTISDAEMEKAPVMKVAKLKHDGRPILADLVGLKCAE